MQNWSHVEIMVDVNTWKAVQGANSIAGKMAILDWQLHMLPDNRLDPQPAPFFSFRDFGELLATPRDAKPIRSFPDIDEGFLQVVQAIRGALPHTQSKPITQISGRCTAVVASRSDIGPRSSNLRIKRSFTDADKDQFREDAFAFIGHFFENSIAELARRNPGINGSFKQIHAHQFRASLYKDGAKRSFCQIFMGNGSFSEGIAYSSSETLGSSSFNESLSVESDDDALFLRLLGMGMQADRGRHLTFEGAAEHYWNMFIEPLRR
jgi:hypothetical protein